MNFENLNVGFGNNLLGIWLVRLQGALFTVEAKTPDEDHICVEVL
jgi:hypothetical protein